MYDDILLQVKRPAQYIGHEWNATAKDFDKAAIKFALVFPDLYEIGMSNLGVRIIYGELNNIPDLVCERFFAVDSDLEGILRSEKREILSLESRKKLSEFDLVGFSLGSELSYTNVLNILDLAHLPLRASSRDHSYPLVIGGGPCVLNPEPMHDFFDFFVIGEAEDLILEIVNTYRKYKNAYRSQGHGLASDSQSHRPEGHGLTSDSQSHKSGKMSKTELLLELAKLDGVYVPSFYDVAYAKDGRTIKFEPKIEGVPHKIKKRFVKDLNLSYYPNAWIVPHIQIVHDRIVLEIMRGCPNRCRFCQARPQYFPLRYRDTEVVLNLAEAIYKRTGYEELSLSGLSVSDYPRIEELLKKLMGLFKPKGVGLSLPSLKAKSVMGGLFSLIAKFKKTGLTLAPEAGSEKLRNILAKDFNSEDFFKALKEAYASGYQHVKLYFMIGIPHEAEEDLDAIIEFSSRVSQLKKEIGSSAAGVKISITNLIPKPHTALQWSSMHDLDSIKRKQDYLKDKSRKDKRLKISFHNLKMSFLEGILSRGDRRLSEVILNAFKKGAKFDAWSSHFNFDIWAVAFKESGVDPGFYLKEKSTNELLPWDFIDIGVDKKTLIDEFNKTIAI
ncbi:MAG: B12-binding domain-containing radical SAM protein [Candidatus Omnitrophica bacterium CG08_land_8_20_14_0_20_41_16]|uniref:B12-binding domain-containing radical SAM protein n=1 Tax=Candidatus Sherwoodlollariibacterium unditelluris TaxID=1974757 RepID=A0A2G9YL65_9BACT|nr:MAG: B12-binding domain-containing radical SAM protein [Candidatus Omnitrophica bacterium CG23_combo_of_CG06-09_8_20_14_all_41_10]PIS33542.1 MAG: B12-binding domain-containing radical SAM protein [Candidatus Omnitrophica bacterium CG08_land_8_20_14_0_20_41_16]